VTWKGSAVDFKCRYAIESGFGKQKKATDQTSAWSASDPIGQSRLTYKTHLPLLGMHNRTFEPYFAATHRILFL
jgi:hypothetical protein